MDRYNPSPSQDVSIVNHHDCKMDVLMCTSTKKPLIDYLEMDEGLKLVMVFTGMDIQLQ